jgi:hypothetical protein
MGVKAAAARSPMVPSSVVNALLAKLVAQLREKRKAPGQKPAPGEKRSI